ncbi:glycosyltransferase [Subtercola frigoramans]|uniref:Glycosyltransferase involved in cell wall biosynthesis n=1 Tax=Subtercola frigoramans TaxID=120298 RepID=A0ABS2L8S7_9MICO|nr:glycosyltransferase [Subtercola frigoramans]MBM7473286.1 glycosyltransferase involved in cell wall biosynthesis [Subtercola frigoramans]
MSDSSGSADATGPLVSAASRTAGSPHVGSLASRLRAIAPHVTGSVDPNIAQSNDLDPGIQAMEILRVVSGSAPGSSLDRDVWLLIVGFTAVYPTLDEHRSVRRALRLAAPGEELGDVLAALEPIILRSYHLDDRIEVVPGAVILDADFSARFDHNTGVQRVLRETASRWHVARDITLVCWNDDNSGLRRLVATEVTRTTDWARHSARPKSEGATAATGGGGAASRVTIVPVDSVVVEIEVAQHAVAEPLSAVAAVSGNLVVMVGHDMIPIVSSDSQETAEIERFARYLTVVKHSRRLAGVSISAADEFSGFASALSAQGMAGPQVTPVPLAMNAPTQTSPSPASVTPAPSADQSPLVLVVGSQEPRKNHAAILFAAQQLWAEGVRFRLRFIGGGSSASVHRFDAELRRLRAGGREVEVLRGASDAVLLDSYREARFCVFPSLHEGFGLPVAESLALGTPVITADHGSLREAAAGGGCVAVDARDDEALRVAMKSLLLDDTLYARLRKEAAERSFRTWDEYAAELWSTLVEPSLRELADDHDRRSHGGLPDARSAVGSVASLAHSGRASISNSALVAGSTVHQLESWFTGVTETHRVQEARRNSLVNKVSKLGPLAVFFVARSREMGVVPASKAALRIVRKRVGRV